MYIYIYTCVCVCASYYLQRNKDAFGGSWVSFALVVSSSLANMWKYGGQWGSCRWFQVHKTMDSSLQFQSPEKTAPSSCHGGFTMI